MVQFDILFIFYANNKGKLISARGVDRQLPEDRTITTVDGVQTRLDDHVRRVHEAKFNPYNNLMYECAKLYIAVSNPQYESCHYCCTKDVVEVDLNSTAGEVRQKFESCFPGADKPMVILKLFYVTRRI